MASSVERRAVAAQLASMLPESDRVFARYLERLAKVSPSCDRCERPLTDELSQAIGTGPECRKRNRSDVVRQETLGVAAVEFVDAVASGAEYEAAATRVMARIRSLAKRKTQNQINRAVDRALDSGDTSELERLALAALRSKGRDSTEG